MIGRGREALEPIFQRFFLRDFQHRTDKIGRQAFWEGRAPQLGGVEHFAGIIDGHVALVVLRLRRETVQCGQVFAAGQQTRPQLDRPGRIRPSGRICGQIAERGGRDNLGRRDLAPRQATNGRCQ